MTIMDKEDNELLSKKRNKKLKKEKKSTKHSTLVYELISFILIVFSVITFGYLIYEEVFSIFYTILIGVVSTVIVFIISYILNKQKLKRWIKNIFSIISVILLLLEIAMLLFGTKTIRFLNNVTDLGVRVETFGVYVLNDSSINDLKDLDGLKVSYLNHEDDTNIRKALKEIEKKANIEYDCYDNLDELLNTLTSKSSNAILLDASYETVLNEEYNDIYNNIRLIKEIDIVDQVDVIKSDVDITKEPFAIYISGIDTSGKVASKARSDVNIIVGVNPVTKNIVMVNTPRDYYVTLASKNKKDKLTHAGLYGIEESLNTLANFYDVDIDYYARINFTSFVKIVDALGGITVDVPKDFCEQNSKRSFAQGDLICLSKGRQTLNGEQALALARHRKTLANGDRTRGENQMMILEAIMNKAMTPKIITKFNSLVSALDGKVTTNMNTSEMFRFIKKNKNNLSGWKFNSVSASGKDSSGICYATGSGKAYVMEPDQTDVDNIKRIFNDLFTGMDTINVEKPTTTTTSKTTSTTKKITTVKK